MALMRWDPRDVDRFRDDINRYWNHFREEWMDSARPRTRIHQANDGYWVDFELPGVKPDEVDIEVDNDSITVTGEFPGSPIEGETERETFHSTVGFPSEVDAETAEAEFHHGLLRVHVIKAGGRRRRIPIKSMS